MIILGKVDHPSEDHKASILNNLVDSQVRLEEISPPAHLYISGKVLPHNSSTTVVPLLRWEWHLLQVSYISLQSHYGRLFLMIFLFFSFSPSVQ